jgi:hypothetical protein
MGARELWLNVGKPWQLRRRQESAACAVVRTETAEVVEVKATVPFPQRSRAGSRR